MRLSTYQSLLLVPFLILGIALLLKSSPSPQSISNYLTSLQLEDEALSRITDSEPLSGPIARITRQRSKLIKELSKLDDSTQSLDFSFRLAQLLQSSSDSSGYGLSEVDSYRIVPPNPEFFLKRAESIASDRLLINDISAVSPEWKLLLLLNLIDRALQLNLYQLGYGRVGWLDAEQWCPIFVDQNSCAVLGSLRTLPIQIMVGNYMPSHYLIEDIPSKIEELNKLLNSLLENNHYPDAKVALEEISSLCQRNIVFSGYSPLVSKIDIKGPHRFTSREHLHTGWGLLPDDFDFNNNLEVWAAPHHLSLYCLNELGYTEIEALSQESFRWLYSAKLKGETVYIIIGNLAPQRWFWVQLMHRITANSRDQFSENIDIVVPHPSADKFWKTLAEIWHFRTITVPLQSTSIEHIHFGYGPSMARSFSKQFIDDSKVTGRCTPEMTDHFQGFSLPFYRDNGEQSRFLYISTAGIERFSIPMSSIGETLGKRGTQSMGHIGTSGSLHRDILFQEIHIPKYVQGLKLNPSVSWLEPLPLIANSAYQTVKNDHSLANNHTIFSGGIWGNIYHPELEFVDLEKALAEELNWQGVETNAYNLFSGILATNPTARVYTSYIVSDESTTFISERPRRWGSLGRSWHHHLNFGFDLLKREIGFAAPLCLN